jgi:hypothetical protein
MLQTSILRTVRMAPPKAAPAAAWRCYRAPRLPQITLILGMLALLGGVLWGVNEYEEHQAELRRAETGRYLDQFRSGPVAAAWGRLRAAWQAEQDRQHALLVRIASPDDGDRAQALRDHRLFVLETIEEYGLHDEIEEVTRFLVRLVICVRAGSCDADVTVAQLGPALWAFRDQHEPYFRYEYSGHQVADYIAIIAPRPERQDLHAARRW